MAAGPRAAASTSGAGDPRQIDPLTGLAGWDLFALRAAAALDRATHAGASTAVLVVDIDEFHRVNNERGHEAGDRVLAEVARRLQAGFRPGDEVGRPGAMIARLGGDEFVILCEDVRDAAAARSLSRRVTALLEGSVHLVEGEVLVTAAVGVTLAAPGVGDVEECVLQADAAMRWGKQHGRGTHTMFSEGMAEAEDRSGDADDLARGFEAGELRLQYQPKVALDSDRIVGVEALLRWQHPQRGMRPPLEFIPLAEQTGLIVPIGTWVIEEACREAARWQRSFPDRPTLVVSVNVSARQFVPGLIEVVASALSASGAEPGSLCIELTEAFLMDDADGAVVILHELAALGVVLSIDDFGTGYSSLSRLKRFPMHELKIDKSFVDGLGRNADDTAIVAAVVAMAHALELSVVAEGVETVDQLEQLRMLGCEQAQGFYLARPGSPGAIDALLRAETNLGWHSHASGATSSDAGADTYRPNRILVVDDAANVRQLARMSLTAVGFEVHEAADGITALATARRVAPDCVLLDLALPDMRGLDVCRALRADPTTAACTILILTVTDHAVDKVEAFSSGADDYIIKPFSPRDLVSRVHAAMRRRREGVDADSHVAALRG